MPDRTLLDFLLDQEAPLRDLMSLVIALDLIVSDPDGIDKKDVPGAKIVAVTARNLVDVIRETWRQAVKTAKEDREAGEADAD